MGCVVYLLHGGSSWLQHGTALSVEEVRMVPVDDGDASLARVWMVMVVMV